MRKMKDITKSRFIEGGIRRNASFGFVLDGGGLYCIKEN